MRVASSTLFVTAASIGVLIAVAAGLATIGSPANVRLQRLDDARSQDLLNISNAIRSYRLSHDALPEGLERLQADGNWSFLRFKDVESGSPYEYKVVDASSYELCAGFATAADGASGRTSVFWNHPQGRHCFALEAAGGSTGGRGLVR